MKYTKKVLPNGMRVMLVPMKDSQTVTVMSLVETGSFYETKKTNGISHFLEHMCFKGTTNRSGEDIKLELDLLGESNAFTGYEYTGYYVKTHRSHLDRALDIIADIYQHSTFPERDIEKERGVIIEEMHMYRDMPQSIVADVWRSMLFPNQSAGYDILGLPENIKRFSQKDFLAYHKQHYVASKTVLVIAGNFETAPTTRSLQKLFADVHTGKEVGAPKTRHNQTKPRLNVHYKKSDQAHMIVGFRSFPMFDKRQYALGLASTILGRGFSSRLYKTLRDDHGLCYYVSASNSTFRDHGTFAVSAGVNVKNATQALELIMHEFKMIRDHGVTSRELKKAKDMLLNRKALNLETSDQLADFYGFQEIFRDTILTPRDVMSKIKKVTVEDIQKALRDVMKEGGLNCAIVGPYKNDASFKPLLNMK